MEHEPDIAVNDFSSWVSQGSGRLRSVRGLRLRLLSSLVGNSAVLSPEQGDGRYYAPGSYIANDPMPPELAARAEAAARQVHMPDRRALQGRTVYVLPSWLLPVRPGSVGVPSNGVRIRLRTSGRFSISIEDPVTCEMPVPQSLRAVSLLSQERSKKRRIELWQSARRLIHKFENAVGRSHVSGWEWLHRMIRDPVDAESHALGVWNAALSDLDVPESFRGKTRIYSLWDHFLIHQCPEKHHHWRSLVEQQPWAARRLLDGTDPPAALDRIEDSPLGIIRTTASILCCRCGESGCAKARKFADSLPGYREVSELDRILGGDRNEDISTRALLMEAHLQGGEELLSELCRNVPLSHRQVRRARELFRALTTGLSSNSSVAHAVSALLVRMMVRDRFDPDHLDPDAVATGLITVSADCLACFAARRTSEPQADGPEEFLGCDSIDSGLFVLAKHLGDNGNRSLTTEQLIHFATSARELGAHRVEIEELRRENAWPLAPGIPERNDFCHMGTRIVAVTESQGLVATGLRAAGCPTGNHYADAANLGRLIPFLLERDNSVHGALVLRPNPERRGRRVVVAHWEISELLGPGNARPDDTCKEVAEAFRCYLNGLCPSYVPEVEIRRRQRARREIDEFRSFNRDPMIARKRWNGIYANLLPRRFARISPRELMHSYFGGGK